ncbi:hypothetical protein FRB94_011992 [Tulasnella sp. JGI-2019a]|nr:hypothetical protein FRB93_009303 [Tulasnella sp. JGI-2019a]KAG8992130.1 hypothetical protein FRB94_011992 [Tulasnella sp. JGI-2019a]
MFLPPLLSVLTEPVQLALDLVPFVRLLLPKQDHFAPHPGVPFEGYYTRILTTTGNTILLIFSSVPGAKTHTHHVHFSHIIRPSGLRKHQEADVLIAKFPKIDDPLFQTSPNGVQPFRREAVGDGLTANYDIRRNELKYQVKVDTPESGYVEADVEISGRMPWVGSEELSTPEGIFSRLVFLLPLHWNIWSTASHTKFSIKRDGKIVEEGEGIAHVEKNWGTSFPLGWTWMQGFSSAQDPRTGSELTTFALAGGKIIGQRAYLLGYRSPALKWSFRPLFTMMPFGFQTPFISEKMDARAGTAHLDICSVTRRLVIDAQAPPDHDGWIPMNCPLSNGHGNEYGFESFEAVIRIKAYVRTWYGGWMFVEESVLENAALEFGGDYSFKASQTMPS